MKKLLIAIFALSIFGACNPLPAQTLSVRGLYVDNFTSLYATMSRQDSLINYGVDSGYTYFALAGMSSLDWTDSATKARVDTFIYKAHLNGLTVGACIDTNALVKVAGIIAFDTTRTDTSRHFNAFLVEFPFWATTLVGNGKPFCQSISDDGYACDTAGAFAYYKRQLVITDSLNDIASASKRQRIEAYIDTCNRGQAQQVAAASDRLHMSSFIKVPRMSQTNRNDNTYIQARSGNTTVVTDFNASSSFSAPWLAIHSCRSAWTLFMANYNSFYRNSAASRKLINIGYMWRSYTNMPR